MKKYIIPIVLCCLCACTTELPDTGADIDTAGHTLFSVDIENLSLGGSSIPGSWNAGDCIGVFGSESGQNVPYYLKRQQDGLQAASFYGEPQWRGAYRCGRFPQSGNFFLEKK